MSTQSIATTLGAAAFAASLAALAQTAPPEPAGRAPAAQALPYTSAFESYRSFAADDVGDWRKANDTVREIGGWRAYAREISGGAPAPAGAESAPRSGTSETPRAPASAANPHAGHHQ